MLAASSDRNTKTNPKAPRFFTGFLVGEGSSELHWAEFATYRRGDPAEAIRQESKSGSSYPDTDLTLWRTPNGHTYARFERGITSGIGWYERAEYYFRKDGTLARLSFLGSSPVSDTGGELTQYYNEKGKLMHSFTSSEKGKAAKLSPRVYKRVSELPVYKWLKKPKP